MENNNNIFEEVMKNMEQGESLIKALKYTSNFAGKNPNDMGVIVGTILDAKGEKDDPKTLILGSYDNVMCLLGKVIYEVKKKTGKKMEDLFTELLLVTLAAEDYFTKKNKKK